MPILALDTSAAIGVAVLDDDAGLLAARTHDTARHHAELLAPTIAETLAAAGLSSSDITVVVVGTGPGPYTGLRAGIVTGRTFARGTGATLLGVSSLDALAAQAAERHGLTSGDHVVVATDARRREVYWARYEVEATAVPVRLGAGGAAGADDTSQSAGVHVARVRLVAGPAVASADALVADGSLDGALVTGRGVHLYPVLDRSSSLGGGRTEPAEPAEPAEPSEPGVIGLPDPAVLARIALLRHAAGDADQLGTEPLYLRRPDVHEAAARKRVLG